MNPICAGKLPDRITIERNDRTRAGSGKFTDNWVEYCRAWTNVTQSAGRSFFVNQQENSERTVELPIRWQRGIVAEMRVKWIDPKAEQPARARYLDIRAVLNPTGQRDMLILQCRELNQR